ncbi:MarR family winged helix-turn-helix transcriptional regulator [Streptomyces sp. JH002]|uniref:MarR family winged helix-turn-helix transcriptional regulator n=1 Tax=Streptomyces sp. JH002 TaxID=2763259 RepID=UPI003D80703E
MSGERARGAEAAAGAGAGAERQALLSGTALTAFRLNGQFLSVAEGLARPAGLTAARWQVLGAVADEPLPVSGIARAMGISRQSVQRIADLLVESGLAAYEPNPAHRRAKLFGPTAEGREAMRAIGPDHAAFADRLSAALGGDGELTRALATLRRLSEALDRLEAENPPNG